MLPLWGFIGWSFYSFLADSNDKQKEAAEDNFNGCFDN